ncbi:MAG: hypothetical protein ACOCYW_05015 [Roseicyclus sp.]
MILFSFFGSLFLAGLVAVLFERWGWSHNGIVGSVLITFGAVLVLYFLRALFGLSFGSPGVDAIIGSAAALILVPKEIAYRRKRNRKR